jgi:glucokinase-like ROK family protein
MAEMPGERQASGGVGSPRALREANRARLVDCLRRDGSASQSELARRSGLSRATVFNIVRELERSGVVTLTEAQARGTRAVTVSLSRRAGLAIGIDIDHRHLRVAVCDLNHVVLGERTMALDEGATADTTIALSAEIIEALLDELAAGHDEIVGVGMCLPAPIDPTSGEVGATSILPGWVGVPAAESMQWRLGLPVLVDNDANLGALAELTWGAARGAEDVVYLKLASGVGAGLVIRGELYRGAAGTAGEVGHTTLDERGAVCRCGNRGCLETFVGGEALLRLLRNTHGPDLTLADMVVRAREGDPACLRVVTDAGRYVGIAVANFCNLLAPARVVIGGELAMAGDLLLDPIREGVRRHALRPAADRLSLLPAALGDRAEVLGAIAAVLRDRRLASPRVAEAVP